MTKLIKEHGAIIISYVGVGFISGAVSHGFFSGTRSLIMAVLGIILFILAQAYLSKDKSYLKLFVFGLLFSVCIGMVSGGLQHLLDSPERSLWIVPVGLIVSFFLYARENNYSITRKDIFTIVVIAGVLTGGMWYMIYTMPSSRYSDYAHDHQDVSQHTIHNDHSNHASHADMVQDELSFLALMIPHHQEAIDTSMLIKQSTQNPAIQALADNIIKMQTEEIGMMNGLIKTRYPEENLASYTYENMMRPTSNLDPEEKDKVRLEDMIIHHQGALVMAEKILTLTPRQEIVAFVQAIAQAQTQEIALMKALLGEGENHGNDSHQGDRH